MVLKWRQNSVGIIIAITITITVQDDVSFNIVTGLCLGGELFDRIIEKDRCCRLSRVLLNCCCNVVTVLLHNFVTVLLHHRE
jgi:hypothetical protein